MTGFNYYLFSLIYFFQLIDDHKNDESIVGFRPFATPKFLESTLCAFKYILHHRAMPVLWP